jgi:hypothetical protein
VGPGVAQSVQRLGYGLDDRGSVLTGAMMNFFFSLATASRLDLRPARPPAQWVLGVLFPRVGRPGCGADHSLLSGAEVKNA